MNKEMIENYKEIGGVFYKKETPDIVCKILSEAQNRNSRLRIFYGDTKTGKVWLEEYDIIGYIGRSTGLIKIPLLIKNSNSCRGPAILDHCIVRITNNRMDVYKALNYQHPELSIKEENFTKDLPFSVYQKEDNKSTCVARFETMQKAQNYIEFMLGNRNKI